MINLLSTDACVCVLNVRCNKTNINTNELLGTVCIYPSRIKMKKKLLATHRHHKRSWATTIGNCPTYCFAPTKQKQPAKANRRGNCQFPTCALQNPLYQPFFAHRRTFKKSTLHAHGQYLNKVLYSHFGKTTSKNPFSNTKGQYRLRDSYTRQARTFVSWTKKSRSNLCH